MGTAFIKTLLGFYEARRHHKVLKKAAHNKNVNMSDKCAICKKKIETTFLNKIMGTFVGKKVVCSECQSKYKEKLKEELK